jgi:hypothetical protein
MPPPIFKDTQLQASFDKQGFVVVKFLDSPEVDFLNAEFDKLHPVLPTTGGFISSSFSDDFDYKQKASNLILSVFDKHFKRLFTDYDALGGAFLYKLPSEVSELGVHQDWTIVDEDNFVALNCWVPLTDIDSTNGAIHVLPGTQHTAYQTLRAPTIPFFFSGNEQEAISRATPLYVKAGEAVILNQSIIHYSPPNRSGKIRKAITAAVKTKDAPLLFHYKDTDGRIDQYEMPDNYLLAFENFATSIFQRPQSGRLTNIVKTDVEVLEQKQLIALLDKLKYQSGYKVIEPSFFRKLVSLMKQS